MTNSFKELFISSVQNADKNELLKSIGYKNVEAKQLQRLDKIISSPILALDSSDYDFKYTNQEFILAICDSMQLDLNQAQQYINAAQTDIVKTQKAFKPYIWIDTNFKRTTQPIFALAVSESQRHIFFKEDFWLSPKPVQLQQAQLKIKTFMKEKNGVAGIWGKAQQFLLFVEKDFAYVFDTQGNVVDKKHINVPGAAVLKV